MAVHVPLSVEAQAEAHMLMLASNNVLLPATGRPTITPTQDMVLGIYYLTIDKPGSDNPKICRGAGMRFFSLAEARSAYEVGVTISIEDLEVPETKRGLISAAEKEIEGAQRRYERGEITEVERYNKVIDTWSATTDQLTREVVDNFDRMNPVYDGLLRRQR